MQVRCEDEDREKRGEFYSSGGATLVCFIVLFASKSKKLTSVGRQVIALFVALFALTLSSTCYHSGVPGTRSKFVLSFSLKRNLAALFSPMTSERDFLMLNGVRFVSMAWVRCLCPARRVCARRD